MKINKIGSWQIVLNACRNTVNKKELNKEPSTQFKKAILFSEHSPIRNLSFNWTWEMIKTWVSVHLVRHKYGIEHFVTTQRDDRTSTDRNKSRQDAKVSHMATANAQAIINISRKRLCNKAHIETKNAWVDFVSSLKEVEPELASLCVCECVYRNGLCPEMESCKYNQTKAFIVELNKYVSWKIKDISKYIKYDYKE